MARRVCLDLERGAFPELHEKNWIWGRCYHQLSVAHSNKPANRLSQLWALRYGNKSYFPHFSNNSTLVVVLYLLSCCLLLLDHKQLTRIRTFSLGARVYWSIFGWQLPICNLSTDYEVHGVQASAMANKLVCVRDYEVEASKTLPAFANDYYRTGADQEQTLNDNRQAYLR